MTINQIYSTMNAIGQNIVQGGTNVIDTSTFMNYGEQILSSETNKEKWFNTLCDRIGKTVIAIRSYKKANRNVTVDSFTFGSILQKISFKLNQAEESPQWKKEGINPYTIQPKEGIVQKLFAQDMPSFSYLDVIPDMQIESAFISASAMASFINGLYSRMYNAMEVSAEGMEDYAIASAIAKVFEEATKEVTPVNARRAVDLLALYNKTHTPISSAEIALETPEFLEFMAVKINKDISLIGKMTTRYNDGSVERFTSKDNLIVEMPIEASSKFDVYLKSNTFHKELVSLPNYNTVPYWTSPDDNMNVKVKVGETETNIKNVICVMRDRELVSCTLDRVDNAAQYDAINRRTYVRMSADRRYVVDTSENCIIYFLGDVA